jgi:hypothetical protein
MKNLTDIGHGTSVNILIHFCPVWAQSFLIVLRIPPKHCPDLLRIQFRETEDREVCSVRPNDTVVP